MAYQDNLQQEIQYIMKKILFLSVLFTFHFSLLTSLAQNVRMHWQESGRQDTTITVWRGERISLEGRAIVDSIPSEGLRICGRAKKNIATEVGLLGGVITDDAKGCGNHPMDWPTYKVYDLINTDSVWMPEDSTDIEAARIFCSIDVPRDIKPGRQYVEVRLVGQDTGSPYSYMGVYLNILDRTLPRPHDYKFRTNFWQQPYSVSRWYGLDQWSQDHLDKLRPYMHRLARSGQKCVTAILFYEPWGDQSYDKFSPMIETTLKADSTWSYDYRVFDKWVNMMADCGIDQQIDCYSMVPWDMTFRYWDQAKNDYSYLKATTSDSSYVTLWTNFLTSFAAHLRQKGWFQKTRIAMDERQMPDMLRAQAIVQKAVPGMKMVLAGNYHPELTSFLADYSIAFAQRFPTDTIAARRSRGQYNSVYTCCTEACPNIFSNSLPLEATYIPLFALANDFDGYLHWSWMNWADDPEHESRFRLFSPGDTYVIYPDNHSSVRWERYIEGVEMAEKVRILREEQQEILNTEDSLLKVGQKEAARLRLDEINQALHAFSDGQADDNKANHKKVEILRSVLNRKD